uniref:Neurotransmitter-gated ion-channel ligand-binding domain-containing protein n=1 Tax=Parascaris univalens TaxID=6257 RepID=A0A914ZW64_PARUN
MHPQLIISALFFFSRSVWVDAQSSKVLRSRQIGFEGQILSRLFSDYDEYTRPPVRGCNSHYIDFRFIIYFADSADHSSIVVITSIFINRVQWHQHDADVDVYLRQQWQDTRLAYEVDSREGVEEVVVPLNKRVWEPDTYFTNARETKDNDRRRIVVEPSGYIRSSETRSLVVPVRYGSQYPFVSRRTFKLRLSSYNYPIEDVVYLWANSPPTVVPVEVSEELLSSPYEFTEAVAEDCVGNYTVGVYSCISVSITFSGSASEALFRIFLPSVFLIVASWLHFWIFGSWSVPRTASAAVPFFIFAALLVFYPQPYLASEGVGSFQVWLLFCLTITFLSLVEYFIIICCGIRRTVRYTNGTLNESESPITAAREATEVAYETKCANFKQSNGVDMIARVLFPLVFFVFLIIFLILYLI